MAEQAGLAGDHTSLYMEQGSHTHTLAHTHVQGRHWGVVVVSDLSPTLTLSGLSTTWQHLEATMKYLCNIYRETHTLSLCHAQPHSVSTAHTHTHSSVGHIPIGTWPALKIIQLKFHAERIQRTSSLKGMNKRAGKVWQGKVEGRGVGWQCPTKCFL